MLKQTLLVAVATVGAMGAAFGGTGLRDVYTDGAKVSKFDVYTDGAKVSKFDVYTDGARSTATRDTFTDGAKTSDMRDQFTDGA
ncbi:conserved exported hypothetical protein [Cupriavidus taiwanensis]|uniref:Uncharacterized protein n=1 Tax=Cupriavidus taiwanensis TaxID=164546 RepID=A0A976G288_9BURK|nr:hypothetical protein [Cupriavidus taiwanensis]SOZ14364.1 conserved exported hypothetical protein [Cupriavidus taiwanensis]SOZ25733.1 conserved exported hypothetical protein [Cupriavidus taiwanensis]SOZ44974.1 conserved exported hypothetical protein [Cupriavidus taiwanensis]SOZ57484.1 conserved exported hypothetical protein [Cupriavidus taiwanensis]SOZ58158.1 conserved exported hypothetical protein [Cupriavidus taiwanensis]